MAQAGRSAGRRIRRPAEKETAELLSAIAELRDDIEALSKRIDDAEGAFTSNWREEVRKRLHSGRHAQQGQGAI